MNNNEKVIPTGNEMVSIPDIREKDASIMGITFLHMGYKGLIEMRGNQKPFLKPVIMVDGQEVVINNLRWDRINYWIPRFEASTTLCDIEGIILTPVGERGFIYHIKVKNKTKEFRTIMVGLKGCWSQSIHEINENKEITGKKYVYPSNWNHSIVLDLRNAVNIFSIAPIFGEEMKVSYHTHEEGTVHFFISKEARLEPGTINETNFYWGLGFEEVASTTSAKEMLRKGFSYELKTTQKWLADRVRHTEDKGMDKILNMNLFFNFFFASGITLDTEEFVLVTSRSPRYYVSAAYWDRDSLLWSFPSILLVDCDYAREMLDYVFTKQIKNIGIHSRYIDGTVLEPGFELDELCAPVIALYNYIIKTKEYDYLNELHIRKGLKHILKILESKKHPDYNLYETFLQPTDDMIVYPYLTYNNVLVWRAFMNLSELYRSNSKIAMAEAFKEKALLVEKAIWEQCVFQYKDKSIFAWSLDLNGSWNVYDEPPGSLQLLAYYGFCEANHPVYQNTVQIIRDPGYKFSFNGCNIAEIGCEHAPHPWILSVANSLLCDRKDHCREILLKSDMDNGIACESIDENSGKCTTGEAFATCAGFLAYSIDYAFNKQ